LTNYDKLKTESIIKHHKGINYHDNNDEVYVVLKFLQTDFIVNDTSIFASVIYAWDCVEKDTLRIICTKLVNAGHPAPGLITLNEVNNDSYYKKFIYLKKNELNEKRLKTIFGKVLFLEE
jgi:hypothetical protein